MGREAEAVEVEEGHEVEEARRPVIAKDPGNPTQAEIEEHEIAHLPFRSWCAFCIRGKAHNDGHKRQKNKDKEVN